MKKLFKKMPLVLLGATASIAPLSALVGVMAHNEQKAPLKQSDSNVSSALEFGTVRYEYNGTSTQFVTDTQTADIPNWNPSLGHKNVSIIFNFATWNDHKIGATCDINYNDTGKDITTNVISGMSADQLKFMDSSGQAKQMVTVSAVTYTLTADNKLSFSMTYQVYSTLAANSVIVSASASWNDTNVPFSDMAAGDLTEAYAPISKIQSIASDLKSSYVLNGWTDKASCIKFIDTFLSCKYDVPVNTLGTKVTNYGTFASSSQYSHFDVAFTLNGVEQFHNAQADQNGVYWNA